MKQSIIKKIATILVPTIFFPSSLGFNTQGASSGIFSYDLEPDIDLDYEDDKYNFFDSENVDNDDDNNWMKSSDDESETGLLSKHINKILKWSGSNKNLNLSNRQEIATVVASFLVYENLKSGLINRKCIRFVIYFSGVCHVKDSCQCLSFRS